MECDLAVISEYAERLTAGDKFPALVVFSDGKENVLADGFHRWHAAKQSGKDSFECDVRQGGTKDALWHALAANKTNSAIRSPRDKEYSIGFALAKFPDKTQEQIAEHVGCNQST